MRCGSRRNTLERMKSLGKSASFTKLEAKDKIVDAERTIYTVLSGGSRLPSSVYDKLLEIDQRLRDVRKELWNDYLRNGDDNRG